MGSGTSSGVPRIGNDWGACDPGEPRNRRSRASFLIEHDGTRILVDTSPDMREQLLAAKVSTVDAVIWTHDHADHCHGIDDLRQIFHAMGRPVRGLARDRTMATLRSRFAYAFSGIPGYPPTITGEPLPDALTIGSITIAVVDQPHGRGHSAGLRFTAAGKSIGYATDFHELTPDMRTLYSGLDLWVVDALRHTPHPSHPTVAQIVEWTKDLQPGHVALIHMDQTLDYRTLAATLPDGIEPSYDGLQFTL